MLDLCRPIAINKLVNFKILIHCQGVASSRKVARDTFDERNKCHVAAQFQAPLSY